MDGFMGLVLCFYGWACGDVMISIGKGDRLSVKNATNIMIYNKFAIFFK